MEKDQNTFELPRVGRSEMRSQTICQGGSFALESVAAFVWNGWQACSGISGRFGLEYALLAALDTATEIDDMDVPGFGLHPMKGDRKRQGAVSVSGNWRITFEFLDGNAYSLNYEDYH